MFQKFQVKIQIFVHMYLGCPHYVCMRKSEKSPGKKNWDNELSLNSVDGCSSFQGRDTKLDRFLAQHSMGNSH
jgi:hypothetical protein